MTNLQPSLVSPQIAARELLLRRKARASVLAYANAIEIPGKPASENPDEEFFLPVETTVAHHHRLILEAFERTANTWHGRLMVFLPPGSAKSTYGSVVFPSRFLGQAPGRKMILASYGDDLARKMGRRTRQICRQPRYRGIWGTELSKESSAAEQWALTNGSEYMACGLLSGVTGNRAHGIVIDDPVRGREQANSETIRQKTWDAYQDDLLTRLIPGGWLALIQCMTGDTPVLMSDGKEKPLRDIRPGDQVATYDKGSLSVSTVRRWKNNGPDSVYKMRMKSGKIVKANERHPFLVYENGKEKWKRLKNLRAGEFILMAIGVNGAESNALNPDAKSLQNVKGYVTRTTTRKCGRMEPARRHLRKILHRGLAQNLSIVTELLSTITSKFSQVKAAFVRSVAGLPENLETLNIGMTSYASITATIPTRSEGFCATTAISPSVEGRRQKFSKPPRNTSGFIHDEIIAIEYAGIEDVFDIQVDRTENFIANGLVSHNTRWHEDDIAGRILPMGWSGESGMIECRDGNTWEVLCVQAKAEIGKNDPLKRQPGEYLWPEWFDRKHWAQFESNSRTWASLFQQVPTPMEGDIFRPDAIEIIDAIPWQTSHFVRGWDLGASTDGDPTAGGKLALMPDGRYLIADMVRMAGPPHEVEKCIKNTADRDGGGSKQSIPQDPGQAGKAQIAYLTRILAGHRVISSPETGDKITRAEPFAAQVNAGNVVMLRAPWNDALIAELRAFPNGAHDDQVDALSRAFGELINTVGGSIWSNYGSGRQ